jgi:N-acetylmuramoyl-L-alanine amidase
MNIVQKPSVNFDVRAGGAMPGLLILHYTGTQTRDEAEPYYLNTALDANAGRISPHYLIDVDGTIVQYVDEASRAWHAGKSWWAGLEDINSHSIGIELVNPGHAGGCKPYAQAQMEALAWLARDIICRHAMKPCDVLGHSDIAVDPARKKIDPGEWLDWAWLARRGVGAWPTPEQQDYDLGKIYLEEESALRQAFSQYGYDPRVALPTVVTAFQRHFEPEAFHENRTGIAGPETAARLHWLLRMQKGP